MLNFSGKTEKEAIDQISLLVQNINQTGPVTFLIDRDPEPMLKNVWDATNGEFSCYLVEKNGEERTIRIEAPKTCCGTCH